MFPRSRGALRGLQPVFELQSHPALSFPDPAHLIRNRPKDARRKIFMALRKNNCLSCGKCCKGVGFSLFKDDPNLDRVFDELEKSRKSIYLVSNNNAHHVLFPEGQSCYFLDNGSNSCSIYRIRPMVCRCYPFVTEALYTGVRSWSYDNDFRFITYLSINCPTINSLSKAGIGAVLDTDIMIPVADARADPTSFVDEGELPLFLSVLENIPHSKDIIVAPFLGPAFEIIARNVRVGTMPQSLCLPAQPFIGAEGHIVFPIM